MNDREQLATALRAMLGAYCGEEGRTREACQEAETLAREALAQAEGGDE